MLGIQLSDALCTTWDWCYTQPNENDELLSYNTTNLPLIPSALILVQKIPEIMEPFPYVRLEKN